MNFLNRTKDWFLNIPAWRTNKPILIIESDDWGSIRMSSRHSREKLRRFEHPIDTNPFQIYDGLETTEDIHQLGKVLKSVTNQRGIRAVMTCNFCSANPDFEKIKDSNFQRYFREPFYRTYQTYSNSQDIIANIENGVNENVFEVQFHGTEHLNVNRWMKALQEGDKQTLEAFHEKIFSPAIASSKGYTMEYMDALDYDDCSEIVQQIEGLKEGLNIFQQVWNRSPQSFIAPCYRWSKPIERFLAENLIYFIQGQRAQLHPKSQPGFSQRKIYRYMGQRNKLGQIYTVRNVSFEPSIHGLKSALTMAKKQIHQAFQWKIPAIVSSHRINYTSRLDVANRERGLIGLKALLNWVHNNFPSVEFLGSAELGERIAKTKS